MECEVLFLKHLEAAAPALSVPRVLGHERQGPMLQYTVLMRMPGVAMRRATLDPAAKRETLRRRASSKVLA